MAQWRKCRWLFLFAALSLVVSGSETQDAWIRGIYTGRSPRPVALTANAAWQRAHEIAAQAGDAFVLEGRGQSMQPLYPPGTILVLRTVAYSELKPGQTAVYRNQSQRAVAHVLITKARDGWRVIGLNNRTHDMEPVVADNLIGVVVAAFSPGQPEATIAANETAGSGRAYFYAESAMR